MNAAARARFFAAALCLGAAIPAALGAEEVDENKLFGDGNATVSTNQKLMNQNSATNVDRERVSFSGQLVGRLTYAMDEWWLKGRLPESSNRLVNYTEADILLDVRLLKGIKAFVNFNAYYSPQGRAATHAFTRSTPTNTESMTLTETNRTEFLLKEAFVDANLARTTYFRLGKQVLQWGRGYFWNPTDLINIEKRSFFDLNRKREGVYGFKTHVTMGAKANLYAFLDMGSADNFGQVAAALKAEFLVAGIELAVSAWTKDKSRPVYGLDFATRFLGMDWHGEVALSYGDNQYWLRDVGGLFVAGQPSGDWIGKASLGFTKTFDWDLKDRISLTGEIFYNGPGYAGRILADPRLADPLAKAALLAFYTPNYFARWYAGFFASVAQFLDVRLTLTANGLVNLEDGSASVALGISYNPVNSFTLTAGVNGVLGASMGEFTQWGKSLALDVAATVVF